MLAAIARGSSGAYSVIALPAFGVPGRMPPYLLRRQLSAESLRLYRLYHSAYRNREMIKKACRRSVRGRLASSAQSRVPGIAGCLKHQTVPSDVTSKLFFIRRSAGIPRNWVITAVAYYQ